MFNRKLDARTEPVTPPVVPSVGGHTNGQTTPPPIIDIAPNGSPGASSSGPEAESVIGKDLAIEGQSITIRCKGALHINGSIEAELHSKELTVGQFGTVTGSIAADSIDVWGRVSGAIRGSRVVLHPSADVEGDIHAKSLKVEDGAQFEGRSKRVSDPAQVAPQLEPGSTPHASDPIPLPPTLVRPH